MIEGAGELKRLRTLVEGIDGFPASVPSMTDAQLKAVGEAYLAFVAPIGAGRRRVVDKMPSNFLFAGLIRIVLPEAKIIHSRRDPADTAFPAAPSSSPARSHSPTTRPSLGASISPING